MRFTRKSWRRGVIEQPDDWRPRAVTMIGVKLGGDPVGARRTGAFRVHLMPVSLARISMAPDVERNAWRRDAVLHNGGVL